MNSPNRKLIWSIVALAIILRLAAFVSVGPTTGATAFYYESVAQSLVQGKGFTYLPYYLVNFPKSVTKTFDNLSIPIEQISGHIAGDTVMSVREPVYRYPPAYPIFLAACHLVFGPSPTPVVMIQILLNALVAAWICRLAFYYFQSVAVAAAAGFLMAVWPFTLLNSISYEPTAMLYVTVIGAVYTTTEFHRTGNRLHLAAAGILCGISALLRTDSLFAAFGIAAALLLMTSVPIRARIRNTAIVLVLIAAVMSPWLIRNAMVFHRFVPLSCGLGVNLMIGIGKYIPDSGFPAHDRAMITEELGADFVNGPYNTDDGCYPDGIDREKKRVERAKAYIREHPGAFLISCFTRAPDLFFVGIDTAQKRIGAAQALWKKAAALSLAFLEPLVFILAIIGMVRARDVWQKISPSVLMVVLYAAGHLPMWVEPRYFKPAWPILLLFACAAFFRKK